MDLVHEMIRAMRAIDFKLAYHHWAALCFSRNLSTVPLDLVLHASIIENEVPFVSSRTCFQQPYGKYMSHPPPTRRYSQIPPPLVSFWPAVPDLLDSVLTQSTLSFLGRFVLQR